MQTKQLMNTREVAEMMNVSKWTIFRWTKSKKFPSIRVNGRLRFDEQAVREWLNRREISAE